MNCKVICIVGPTASGKTKLSVKLAKKINSEIISADSMQIYKDLDIATAKVMKKEMEGIPHHMIDICDINQEFSVADFKDMCYHEIDDIISRNKNVVIVGGTGLYINSIVYDLNFSTENVDIEYRKKLLKILDEKGQKYLYSMLENIDIKTAETIHPNNTKRVIRALEIANDSNFLKSEHLKKEVDRLSDFSHPKYDFCVYCIDYPREELYENIEKRIDIMVENGLLDEARKVYDLKLNKDNTCMQAIGYKEFFDYFDGNMTLDEAISNLKKSTRHYAKRQMTWFNNKLNCHYLKSYFDVNLMIDEIIKDSNIFNK